MSEPRPERDFYADVLETVREIPRGRVTSYGAVAKYLGAARSSRMVGWALNGASEQVPAHRVVNRLGELTGRSAFSTPDLMEERLESEGVRVKNYRIVDFARYFWDPCVEMEIDLS
jgi:methylated-DNA-protein-cysteine methyltransferase-like protein